MRKLVDLGAVPQILEQRGDRRPSAAEHPGAVHLLRVAFYGGAGLPGTSCPPCFPVRLAILYAAATIHYAAVHEKPAEHALSDAPRRRTGSSLHAATRAPEPIVPDVFGAGCSRSRSRRR